MAVALVLCMVLSLGITAYADTDTVTVIPGSKAFDATVIAESNGELITADVVHDVTVEWNASGRVLYTLEHQYEWNSTKLAYVKNDNGDEVTLDTKTSPLTYEIDVTNNSNVAVSYVLSFDDKTGDFKEVTATLVENSLAPDNVTAEEGIIPSVIGDQENYIVRDGTVILKSEPKSQRGESTSTDPNETCPYLPSGDSHDNRYYISFTENFTVGGLKESITDLQALFTSREDNIFKLGTFTITFGDVPTAAYFKDTLGYLLTEQADDFPTTKENAWMPEGDPSKTCWVNDGILTIAKEGNSQNDKFFNLEETNVEKSGNDYIIEDGNGGSITFNMSEGKVVSLVVSNMGNYYNGTYAAPETT